MIIPGEARTGKNDSGREVSSQEVEGYKVWRLGWKLIRVWTGVPSAHLFVLFLFPFTFSYLFLEQLRTSIRGSHRTTVNLVDFTRVIIAKLYKKIRGSLARQLTAGS